MTQCVPAVPGITVAGTTILVHVEFIAQLSVLRQMILDTLGVSEIDVDAWYPQEMVLRTYQKVDTLLGGRGLERLGRLVPTRAAAPPFTSAHEILAGLDVAYHMNHRRDGVPMYDPRTGATLEGIGHYAYERLGERAARMTCDSPYPCRFDIGLFHGFIDRLEPAVQVVHDPETCRILGDPACRYDLRW